ncbi:zinc ribbon domain-containing protein [Microseira sp. BLCC-F43]|uniref:zinc ribbon domain-containing protein n=1 Tax=Microseira sp. BLCC-F43 TaxID=3153602 RepID=UPI0035BAFCED
MTACKPCGNCGHVVEKLPLSVREWTCPECRTTHDRDINASKQDLRRTNLSPLFQAAIYGSKATIFHRNFGVCVSPVRIFWPQDLR